MITFQEFDEIDAICFTGACNFSDGKLPLVAQYEFLDCTIVIGGDPDGGTKVVCEVLFQDSSTIEDHNSSSYMRKFDNVDEAKVYLQSMDLLESFNEEAFAACEAWTRTL